MNVDTIVSSLQAELMDHAMFRHPIGILPADIDHMGHVNNSVYLRWVQDAVVRYWESLAPPEAVAKHLWVALKHEISYRRPTFLDDIVVADVIAEKLVVDPHFRPVVHAQTVQLPRAALHIGGIHAECLAVDKCAGSLLRVRQVYFPPLFIFVFAVPFTGEAYHYVFF